MTTINIRQAREEDLGTLLSFEQGVVEAERPFDNSLKDGTIHYYDLPALINSDKAEVLVAIVDDQLVGSGYAKILPAKPYRKFEEYAYLGFMYVRPEYRGRGINQAVLQHLIDWSKDQNITEVRLDVYDENIIAKNSYLKKGFKPSLLEMRLEI